MDRHDRLLSRFFITFMLISVMCLYHVWQQPSLPPSIHYHRHHHYHHHLFTHSLQPPLMDCMPSWREKEMEKQSKNVKRYWNSC